MVVSGLVVIALAGAAASAPDIRRLRRRASPEPAGV
jgi:hypothetical protein